MCHVNVRCLLTRKRKKELEILTEMHAVDVLCLTEAWQYEQHNNHLVHINGFQIPFRIDRPNRRGGGVAVYLRHDLSAFRFCFNKTFGVRLSTTTTYFP